MTNPLTISTTGKKKANLYKMSENQHRKWIANVNFFPTSSRSLILKKKWVIFSDKNIEICRQKSRQYFFPTFLESFDANPIIFWRSFVLQKSFVQLFSHLEKCSYKTWFLAVYCIHLAIAEIFWVWAQEWQKNIFQGSKDDLKFVLRGMIQPSIHEMWSVRSNP